MNTSEPEVADAPERLVEKLKRRSKDDFKGRHFEAALILQAVSWYLRYPLSYRDIEELFLERGLAVDHSTLNRWVLAYAPLIERRLRSFRKPHCDWLAWVLSLAASRLPDGTPEILSNALTAVQLVRAGASGWRLLR